MLSNNQQFFEQIRKADNILIAFSKLWDGDSVSSALGLFLFLQKIEKKAFLVCPFSKNQARSAEYFSFLPEFSRIENKIKDLRRFVISLDVSKVKARKVRYGLKDNKLNFFITPGEGFFKKEDVEIKSEGFKYDLIITLDTPDLESMGDLYEKNSEFFYETPIINIDNSAENEEYGQINIIDLNNVSVSEIIFSFLSEYSRNLIDEDMATCFLAGILFKSNSFKDGRVGPQTLLTASELISMGARREEIVDYFYRSKNLNTLKIWGKILSNLKKEFNGELVWSSLKEKDVAMGEEIKKNLKTLSEEIILNAPETKLIIIFYKDLNNQNSISLNFFAYGRGGLNVSQLFEEYDFEGDKKMIFGVTKPGYDFNEEHVIEDLRTKLKKILP